jgi:DNA polymerase-3 subunit beta
MDFTQQRNALSIMSNVYLETQNNILIIKATDTNIGFSTQIAVETLEEGNTTVYCEKFLEILRLLPDTKILFETKDKVMSIKPENSSIIFNSSIRVIDGNEYPQLEDASNTNFFNISQSSFNDMSDQTIFSVSTDETRYYLCGLLLEKNPTGLTLVGTDGRRLSIVERKFEEPIPDFKSVIIPTKFFVELKKLSTGEGTLGLCIKENLIFAKVGNRFFYSTLIKGQFPDYRRIIPQNLPKTCIIKTQDMINAIKRVSVSIESKAYRIYLQLSHDEIMLYSEENENSEANEKITCHYDNEDCTICLNYLYLLTPLKVMKSDISLLILSNLRKRFLYTPKGNAIIIT